LTVNPISPWGTGHLPYDLAISSNSQYLYVTCATSPGSVVAFSIGSDGTLTPIGPAGGVEAIDTPEGIAIAPNGQYLYVANEGDDDVEMFTINGDGTLTAGNPYGTGGKGPVAIAITPDGNYLYATNQTSGNVSQFAINADGSLTLNTTTPVVAAGDTPTSIAIDPTGTYVYVGNVGDGTLSEYSISGGLLTQLASSPITPDNSAIGVTSVIVAP
jgi:DNA-binding beta-propeller fold protein YncE